jgi:hypothetical protein
MLLYGLIGLSFVLVGVAGLQFTYLFYIGRLDNERKKHVRHLERKCRGLTERLEKAEIRIAEQDALLGAVFPETGVEDEAWADVIEDR